MKKKNIIIAVSVLTLTTLAGFAIFKNSNNDNLIEENGVLIEKYVIPTQRKIFVNGIIEPNKLKTYYKDSSLGNNLTINVENGNYINKGDLLITYKNTDLTDEIKNLESQIQDLKSQKNKAIDDIEKDTIQQEISKISNEINGMKKKEYSYVYAPFNGNIYINAKTNNEDNQEILQLISKDYYVKAQCSEKEHPYLNASLEAEVLILPSNKKVSGKITHISNNPENQSSSDGASTVSNYGLDIALDNQEGLVNGYHVQVSIKLNNDNIEIPKDSVINEESKTYVYIVKDGILKKQLVEVSSSNGESLLIKSGLNEKDEIIENPTSDMKEGQSIE
ncbi:MAG: HlyD family efflux transporter periplasmic adaptor subunit [Romboutsia sp.]